MLLTGIPSKFPVPFAASAGLGFITTPIPLAAQPSGRASLTTGFSTLNFNPIASGGIPPWGADFNGLMFEVTSWLQWAQAGGQYQYDSGFQTSIGGYPKYALIQNAAGTAFWLSTADNNLTNPDAGGAGWQAFPDVIVQKQAGNFAIDNGTPNSYNITLTPQPATIAAIIGAPIRVQIGTGAGANTIVNPTIHINAASGSTSAVMINSNGTPLLIGQLARAGQIFEGIFDNVGFFQIMSPAPISAGIASGAITGVIYEWPAEVPPIWGLECNGAQVPVSSYPALFSVIGFRFGGDGVSNMRLPDKRGAFTRGWDHGRGLDADASKRTTTVNGTAVAGDHVGSWQLSGIGPITQNGAQLNNPTVTWLNGLNPANYPVTGGTIPFSMNWTFGGPQIGNGGVIGGGGTPNILTDYSPGGGPTTDISAFQGHGTSQNAFNIYCVEFTGPNELNGNGNNGFNVGPSAGKSGLSIAVDHFSGNLVLTGNASDTRPVNIDMMYVIAF